MNHNDLYQRWLGTNLEDADLSVKGRRKKFLSGFTETWLLEPLDCAVLSAQGPTG